MFTAENFRCWHLIFSEYAGQAVAVVVAGENVIPSV